jgi:hypothetical protein
VRPRFAYCLVLLLGFISFISLSACTGLLELVSEPGPDLQWSRTFGDGGENTYGNSVQQTTDGGYILCGMIETPDEEGAWLIKTDADGNKLWDNIFNPVEVAWANSVQQTTDGGYILCGTVIDHEEISIWCIWLMKTDADGNKVWDKIFPGKERGPGAWGKSVQQTTDDGYIVCGESDDHVRLIKTDADGNTVWDKTFVAQHMDRGNSVQQTTDGGYIVCGWTRPLIVRMVGKPNVWLIKTDVDGNKRWDKVFGGELYAEGASVQQTTDGGYIICGVGETEKNIGALSHLLIKTDANGNKVWDKIFDRGYGYSAQQTTDGGYILCGKTRSHAGWVIKTDVAGNKLWDKKVGKGFASANSVQQTADGGYIICGGESSAGANHVLLVKIAPEQ